jgi:Transcription initiation factor TFIID, subunit TAF6 (also component of histone acetyltransferase SAGA)
MSERIRITDYHAPELDVYARLREVQLLNRHEPQKGIFIAESPRVIERALDAGCVPLSFLSEEKYVEKEAKELLKRCGSQTGGGSGKCSKSYECRSNIPLCCGAEYRCSAFDI